MTITIGTTPVNLLLFLRGTAYSGASLPAEYPANPNQRPTCGQLFLQPDPTGGNGLYWGDTNQVSSSSYNAFAGPGEQIGFNPGQGKNNVSLAKWLVGTAASTKVNVSINYD